MIKRVLVLSQYVTDRSAQYATSTTDMFGQLIAQGIYSLNRLLRLNCFDLTFQVIVTWICRSISVYNEANGTKVHEVPHDMQCPWALVLVAEIEVVNRDLD
jgi:hypothetical protein